MKNRIKRQELIEMLKNKQISNYATIKRTWAEEEYLKIIDNKLYVYDKDKKEIKECWLDLEKAKVKNEEFEIIGD